MVNTGGSGYWLFAQVEESLTILESPDTPPLSNSFSSLGTDQGVQGLMALLKAALQTQCLQNEGRRNAAGGNKTCQSEGCQSGADQNQGCHIKIICIEEIGFLASVSKPMDHALFNHYNAYCSRGFTIITVVINMESRQL